VGSKHIGALRQHLDWYPAGLGVTVPDTFLDPDDV